jgi:hypothetical protein
MPHSKFCATCDDQASSHPSIEQGAMIFLVIVFEGEKQTTFLMEKISFNVFREHGSELSTCRQLITGMTKIMCNIDFQ